MPNQPRRHSQNHNSKIPIVISNNSNPTNHGTLLLLPSESLTHLTSSLDPKSLFSLSLVNHALFAHISNDHTWRIAFNLQFLNVAPEADISRDNSHALLLRKTETTWRKEFVKRWILVHRFTKSANAAISHSPHHGTVASLILLPDRASLLTSSLEYGIVSRSFPFTGKVLKGYLDAHGALNGQGIGNPNAEFAPNVSTIELYSSGGGTAKVAWGFLNGDVALTTAPKVMDLGKNAKFSRSRASESHPGVVNCICFGEATGSPGLTFASACGRGTVKIWETNRMRCIWSYDLQSDSGAPPSLRKIDYDASSGSVIVATDDGDVHVWLGLQVDSVIRGERLPNEPLPSLAHQQYAKIRPPKGVTTAPSYLLLRAHGLSVSRVTFAIAYAMESHFYRVLVEFPQDNKHVARSSFIKFDDGPMGSITCFKAGIIPWEAPEPSITPPTNENAILPLSNRPTEACPSRSFILTGDVFGRISIWDWDAEPVSSTDVLDALPTVGSLHRWEVCTDGALTAIEIGGAILVTGSARGVVQAWDSLTFEHLRTFSSHVTRPQANGEWEKVSHIAISHDVIVASIGSRVFAWRAVGGNSNKADKGKGKRSNRSRINPTAKWQQHMELKRDILDSRAEIAGEGTASRALFGRERDQLETLDKLGLDEVEAIEYVLMLSRDEEEERRRSAAAATTTTDLFSGHEDDLLFEMNEDMGASSPESQSPSPVSYYDQPKYSPSSSFTQTPSSFTPTPIPSRRPSGSFAPSYVKIQVSPRARPEPREAGATSVSPLDIRNPSIRSFPFDDGAFPAVPLSPRASSSVSPRSGEVGWGDNRGRQAHSPGSVGSSTKRSWSAIAKGSPSDNGIVRSGSGTSSQTDVTPMQAGRREGPSLLTARLARSPGLDSGNSAIFEIEDDELRYILELSLAEARSRGDA